MRWSCTNDAHPGAEAVCKGLDVLAEAMNRIPVEPPSVGFETYWKVSVVKSRLGSHTRRQEFVDDAFVVIEAAGIGLRIRKSVADDAGQELRTGIGRRRDRPEILHLRRCDGSRRGRDPHCHRR